MNFKSLEEKCLYYRGLTDYRILPNANIIAMVDGRAFSKLVKKRFKLPFDKKFIEMMNETARYVCEHVQGCKFAYVQSDEISFLITDYETPEADSFFSYRLCKMQSIIASLATAKFNQLLIENEIKERAYDYQLMDFDGAIYTCRDCVKAIEDMKLAEFDCKVWPVPSSNDAFAWFLYRQIDCIRNSKQQTAQTYLSHKQLLGLDTDAQIALLKEEKGVSWEHDFTDGEKYGRFIYQEERDMEKEWANQVIKFKRKVWDAHNAFPLTVEGSKERFYDIIPALKLR
jgi:tRNA(His) 5'-end guanylyltransferase